MIAEPPFDAGALNVTVACALPAVALAPVGAPGTVATFCISAPDVLTRLLESPP